MPSPTRKPPPPPLKTYGLKLKFASPPTDQTQLQLFHEQYAFLNRWPIDRGGLPRHEHFRNMSKIMWPWLDWHPWLEWSVETMCNNQFVGMTGCAASAKTTAAIIYGTGSWLCAPDCTSVILTSTTKSMIRKRGWPWVQKLYTGLPGNRVGNMVDSKTIWQDKKGDDLNAIFGIAVKEGSTAKAVAHIQGIHNKRIIIIVDEATDTPEAILEACTNLITGCDDFQLIVIGNAASRLDPHGKFCEPLNGWNSISVEDEEWETTPKLNDKPGICIHFDAEKSPNIVAGETRWRYLPNRAGVEAKRNKLGLR